MSSGGDESSSSRIRCAAERGFTPLLPATTPNGSHYTTTDELPLVPGIDGVGRLPTGELVYFVLPDTRLGAMAEGPSSTAAGASR